MEYQSTRNKRLHLNSLDALNQGLAPDGGLFVPASFPNLDLKDFLDRELAEISHLLLSVFFDDFAPDALKSCIDEAYGDAFDTPEITPLKAADTLTVLELFHGPTAAFKDIALQLLPRLLARIKADRRDPSVTAVLTATSGDTGSAALNGFKNVPGFTMTVFYPETGISAIQRKQMTTVDAPNVHVYGIKGNFDDAQRGVKAIFRDAQNFPVNLSSANSINIGRFLPQVAYYFKAYADLVKMNRIVLGDEVVFAVPTGNFGNILAAYVAKRCGLPVEKLICASNENDVLTDFIRTGTYNRLRPFKVTASPSMDILVSSNLERLLYWLSEGDDALIRWLMADLETKGSYTIPETLHLKLRDLFTGTRTSESETALTIRQTFEKTGTLLDPHTAVAFHAAKLYQAEEPEAVIIVTATASPYKFPKTVLSALGYETSKDDFRDLEQLRKISGIPLPAWMEQLGELREVHTRILTPEEMAETVKGDHHGL